MFDYYNIIVVVSYKQEMRSHLARKMKKTHGSNLKLIRQSIKETRNKPL